MKFQKYFLKTIIIFLLLINLKTLEVKALNCDVQDKDLITSVSNCSNGKISITFSVPANTSVTVKVYPNLKINGRQYGEQTEKNSLTFKNNSKRRMKITKTMTTKFYGNYIVHASYGFKDCVWDEHFVDSKLTSVKYSKKYTWTARAIKNYINGKQINIATIAGASVIIGYTTHPAVGSIFTLSFAASDIKNCSAQIASESKIHEIPIEGYSYL